MIRHKPRKVGHAVTKKDYVEMIDVLNILAKVYPIEILKIAVTHKEKWVATDENINSPR